MDTLATISQTSYVNLRTYRKNEMLVDTPVWYAAYNNAHYFFNTGCTGLGYE